MLFNSYSFILLFLPSTLIIFHVLHNNGQHRAALVALALASFIFYGWWSLGALLLLLTLMAANYVLVWCLLWSAGHPRQLRVALLTAGIAGNLAVLGYFKYVNFFLESWSALVGTHADFVAVVLPLGLSFFTFQKIALLVDAYQGRVQHFEPLGYVLFVSFFPQLIAGPIVHHSEVMPEFARRDPMKSSDFAQGLMLFAIGLSKKVLLADTLAQFATPVFDAAASGRSPSVAEAWAGSIAYALQLYFDFSGYSDMAIGLALLFGVRLPVNFNSPYKAVNIIELWRRWHMTLSRFLRDYLYIPLGGGRNGQVRRYINLLVTMMLGGLWHGASWTFVLWGLLHGAFLGANHAWIAFRKAVGLSHRSNIFTRLAAQSVTFIAVLIAWVVFRAADFNAALLVLRAMIGLGANTKATADMTQGASLIVPLLAVVWFAPNSSEIVGYAFDEKHALKPRSGLQWTISPQWAGICGALLALCLMSMTRVTEFLYFQF
jgi:alginate O-acetyltransferase complex protein AlgI